MGLSWPEIVMAEPARRSDSYNWCTPSRGHFLLVEGADTCIMMSRGEIWVGTLRRVLGRKDAVLQLWGSGTLRRVRKPWLLGARPVGAHDWRQRAEVCRAQRAGRFALAVDPRRRTKVWR